MSTFTIDINRNINDQERNWYSLGNNNNTNILVTLSNHILLSYHNRIIYKDNSINRSVLTASPPSVVSSYDLLFGQQDNTSVISPPPSFIKYRIE